MTFRSTALATAVVAALGLPAMAQEYPAGDVTVIVPFAPGGAVDTTNRIIAERANAMGLLGEGNELVIENISNTVVGQATPAREAPDGQMVLAMTSSVVTNPKLRDTPYALSDYTPVALYTLDPEVIVVPTDSEFETAEQFIEAAKGGEVTVVTSGVGTSHHMSGIALQNRADLNLNIINVDAFGEQVQQIAGGHVQAALWPWGEASKQVEAGLVRPLAIAARERSEDLPDVPTWDEAGLGVTEFATFRGWGVAAETPDEIVGTLAGVLQSLSEDEDFVQAMAEAGYDVQYADSEGFSQTISNYDELTTEIIDKAGLASQ